MLSVSRQFGQAGEEQSKFPAHRHDVRDPSFQEKMGRGDRPDRQSDVVEICERSTGSIFYIAGPPGMVTEVRKMLLASSVNEDDIRTDEFAGY